MDVCPEICDVTISSDNIDEGSIIAGLQAFPAWQEDLNYPTGARLGALNACGQIAGLCVGPIIAYIDENYGRKWGIRCRSTIGITFLMLTISLWILPRHRYRHWLRRRCPWYQRLCS
jgi:hypothetical protein